MVNMRRIPDSELKIMMIIWGSSDKVTSEYIMDRLDKSWVKCTVLKFLTRLCERGFLRCHKDGKFNVYETLIKKEEYLQNESKNFLEKMHHNSLTSLVAALYNGNSVTNDDLEELKKFIEETE